MSVFHKDLIDRLELADLAVPIKGVHIGHLDTRGQTELLHHLGSHVLLQDNLKVDIHIRRRVGVILDILLLAQPIQERLEIRRPVFNGQILDGNRLGLCVVGILASDIVSVGTRQNRAPESTIPPC